MARARKGTARIAAADDPAGTTPVSGPSPVASVDYTSGLIRALRSFSVARNVTPLRASKLPARPTTGPRSADARSASRPARAAPYSAHPLLAAQRPAAPPGYLPVPPRAVPRAVPIRPPPPELLRT